MSKSKSNNNDNNNPKPFASSPCYAHELEDSNSNSGGIDPSNKVDVARWRKDERGRLLAARMKVRKNLKSLAIEIDNEIRQVAKLKPGLIISFYWPMRGELDFRDMMHALVEEKVRVALPVVIEKSNPMIFREWTPETLMERGIWNIPFPAEGEPITPDVVIAPLVGFDAGCYRLGYGGGYFDRTLASLSSQPTVIGVGPPLCEIPTIYPQPHDIPMDIIVTGAEQVTYRKENKSEVP